MLKEFESSIKYLVIGNPINHSKSPQMQNAAFKYYNMNCQYDKLQLEVDEFEKFITFAKEKLLGFNITVPYKKTIIRHLDWIDEAAAEAQSVNTVKIDDGKLYGFSTDGIGLENSIFQNFGIQIKNSSFLIVGAGGAGQAAAWHFIKSGVKKLFIANRTLEKAELLCNELRSKYPLVPVEFMGLNSDGQLENAISQAQVLINCSSSGLKADDKPIFNFELLKNKKIGISDLIYHLTPLQKFACDNNLPCSNGIDMLVGQGAASFEIWTGRKAPAQLMKKAIL